MHDFFRMYIPYRQMIRENVKRSRKNAGDIPSLSKKKTTKKKKKTRKPWPEENVPRHDKPNKMTVRPAKAQISLGIRPVWSESSLSAWRKLGSLATH